MKKCITTKLEAQLNAPITEAEIKKSKFLSLMFYSKLLLEISEICNNSKKRALNKLTSLEDLQTAKTVLSSLLDSNTEINQSLRNTLINTNKAKDLVGIFKKYNLVIKEKCIDVIKQILKTISIPDDLHSPKEMFFLKLKSLLIFLDSLIMLEEIIEEQEIETYLKKTLLSTIDKVAEEASMELKLLQRRTREKSFPSDVYYPWYLNIVCEYDDTVSFVIGDWQCKKLIDLLDEVSESINFNKREFSQPDEIYILIELSRLGFAKVSTKPKH